MSTTTTADGDNNKLVFAVNGELVRLEAKDVSPNLKLATFLRDTMQLRGTKIGCGEGGCGACSVLLSRWDGALNKVVTVSANACLRPMTTLHGYMVTTVEGIGCPAPSGSGPHKKGPHAIQKRFHQLNASQCGFCTPGFVVSLYGQLAKKAQSTMHDIEQALDGNLCRCTGYRPILDAAKSFAVDTDVVDSIGRVDLPQSEGLQVQGEIDAAFPEALKATALLAAPAAFASVDNKRYVRVGSIAEALAVLASANDGEAAIVVSQTSAGVYKTHLPQKRLLIDASSVPSLRTISSDSGTGLRVGAAVPISTFLGALLEAGARQGGATQAGFLAMHRVMIKIANVHVRDVGSIGGNLMMAKNLGFASDLATPLCAAGATVTYYHAAPTSVAAASQRQVTATLYDFLHKPDAHVVLESIEVPFLAEGDHIFCYRQAIRTINAHAILNAAFRVSYAPATNTIQAVSATFGAAGEPDVPGENAPRRYHALEILLDGKLLLEAKPLSEHVIRHVASELHPEDFIRGSYKRSHRVKLVRAFATQFLEDLLHAQHPAPPPNPNSVTHAQPLHVGRPLYTTPETPMAPVGEAIARTDGIDHACGTAIYVSDIKESKDALYLAWVQSTIPKGTVKHMPTEILAGMEGHPTFFGPDDFPKGTKNEVLNLVAMFMPHPALKNFPILVKEVSYVGQFIGVVIAESLATAQSAAKQLSSRVTYDAATDFAITTEQAIAATGRVFHTQTIKTGEPEATAASGDLQHAQLHVAMNSQKHFYMETHAAYAVPHDSYITVHVSSQGSQVLSLVVANALGRPQHEVQIKQHRIGGSFGAKLAAEHAIMAAIIANQRNRAVKFQLDRNTDMRWQGGRQETTADIKIDFSNDGTIAGLDATCFKNCGDRFDWSSFTVMQLLPGHIGSVYAMPNRHIVSTGVRTNTATRCAVRAPGEIEAAFITEEIIDRVAFALGVHSQVVREKNFRAPATPEGSDEVYTFPEMYESLMNAGGWRQRLDAATAFNAANRAKKRGVAVTPFKYHVSARGANAQVNVYPDGSVLVHHCGVEMGQGLIIKVLQAAAYELSKVCGTTLPLTLFKSAGNDTFVVPLGGVTGGSTGSEANVLAVINAASVLVDRLKAVAATLPPELAKNWHAVVGTAMKVGVDLVAAGQCRPIPPAHAVLEYNIYCAGAAEIELDVHTGQVTVLRVDLKYDAARSLNPAVDIGQAEGAFVFGLGYLLLEDSKLCPTTGTQPHDGTWEYKIPSVQDTPLEFNVELIHNEKFAKGIMSSKASGEPPLCAATSVTSAIRQALTSARRDAKIEGFAEITVPWTCDKLALACGPGIAL